MSKIRVGVLRGGPSNEYEVSLRTGSNVLQSLPEKYEPVDIFIDRDGKWHIGGFPHEPNKALQKVDVVLNALHGEYGEDGQVQHILDSFRTPYTGSRTFASAVAMNKSKTKDFLKKSGIKTPYYKILDRETDGQTEIFEVFRTVPHPAVVKPLAAGSSVGVSVVFDFNDLMSALEKAFAYSKSAIVEEYIRGREATCGVIDSFRGEDVYALLPVEVSPPSGSPFFDYQAKYGGESRTFHPGRFSEEEKNMIKSASIKAHEILGLRHYSRSDFIVSPSRGVHFLEVNTLPDMSIDSIYIQSLEAVGMPFSEFLDHLLRLALAGQ